MKKSEIYYHAQICVLNDPTLASLYKLEILRELMHQEGLAKFCEQQEEKENAE